MQKKLLLIDAYSLAFKAFYAFPLNLTNPDGVIINAVFGFISILYKVMEEIQPTHVAICLDLKGPTFRHELYPDYKGHRSAPPEEFIPQIPLLKSLLSDLQFTQLSQEGFEADDIIGDISVAGEKEGFDVYIFTSDKDSFQLVTDRVKVVTNQKGGDLLYYTPELVEEKMGVRPDQVVDLKSLQGDPSDNIPGVMGVGQKTAAKLLAEHQTLDRIYETVETVPGKALKEKLIRDKEKAYLSQKLAQIELNTKVTYTWDSLAYVPDWASVLPILKQNQFISLYKKYQSKLSAAEVSDDLEVDAVEEVVNLPSGDYSILDLAGLKKILPTLRDGFAIDLETTSLNFQSAQIVGISLSLMSEQAYYVPLNDYLSAPSDEAVPMFGGLETKSNTLFEMNPLLTALKPLLEDPEVEKYTHHGKYEYLVFSNYNITLEGIAFDTLLAAYLLYPGERMGLKDLAKRRLNLDMQTYESVVGKGKAQLNFSEIPVEDAYSYACADADVTYRLKNLFEPLLSEKDLMPLFADVEMPLQLVLAKMEKQGVALNVKHLEQMEKDISAEVNRLTQTIYELAGHPFNINSTQQLAVILFDELELPVQKKTKTGRSTDSSVLEKLVGLHPIIHEIMSYRELEKLNSTYVKSLPLLVSPFTHRIHTSFNQTVAVTGRLSSTAPNLQNIPIRSENGHKVREAFIATSDEYELLSADYSQIELRLMAHLSEDDHMISAFNRGEDIHASTAALINGISVEDVTKEQRYDAKAVNFGIIYGISPFGLSQNLSISRSEAKYLIEHYFSLFPKVKQFMEDTIEFAKEHGFVKTEFGRLRPTPEIYDKVPHRRHFGERAAINTRLQGTAADIIKISMIRLQRALEDKGCKSKLIIQVHDELILDVFKPEKEFVERLLRETMESVVCYKIPLCVDVSSGETWKVL